MSDPSIHTVPSTPPSPDDNAARPTSLSTAQALEVMASVLYRDAEMKGWMGSTLKKGDFEHTGVCVRSKHDTLGTYPRDQDLSALALAMSQLRARAGLKMLGQVVDAAFCGFIDPDPGLSSLFIDTNTRIQVVDSVVSLGQARKSQYAAFVRDEGVLCVWADSVENLVPTAEKLERALLALVWKDEKNALDFVVDLPRSPSAAAAPAAVSKKRWWKKSKTPATVIPSVQVEEKVDAIAEAESQIKTRPTHLISPVYSGLATVCVFGLLGLQLKSILVGYLADGNAMRLALTLTMPFLFLILAYPCNVVVNSLAQLIGPIAQVSRNSANYSAVQPPRDRDEPLSWITVQVPVYKESLEQTIVPTIESVKAAMTTYERQGGIVNVIVCDDGMQLLSDEDREKRKRFYLENNVAFVARPPHSDTFQRRGRFKKAGNLNHCNALSLKVEELMETLNYHEALDAALEVFPTTWATGNIRIGEIILLIDSDTRVPTDCFMDASLEMMDSPEVGIIQHASGVMRVAHHFFENGMAWFTELLQVGITFVVSNGDVAPFVGHNAFLRWSALQDIAQGEAVWSEEHVSEDFECALKLQRAGWTIRWATYADGDFKEGVSLTCADEQSRWSKYAFGCSEIVFRPFRSWFRGPITPLMRQFVWGRITPSSKFNIMAYIFSYYAIGIGWLLTIFNVFWIGILQQYSRVYMPSWDIMLTCLVVFSGASNLAICVLRFRLKWENSGRLALRQLKWFPFLLLFFGGLSITCSTALVAHLVSWPISWSATSKEVHQSNFFLQLPFIIRRFWPQLLISLLCLAGIAVVSTDIVGPLYKVYDVTVMVPYIFLFACHFLWPFVLDPYFTTFTF